MHASTQGLHHLGLSVLDVNESAAFFQEVLGFKKVGEKPYPAIFVSDGSTMLTLWQVEQPAEATPFNRRQNIGLHHFAMRVAPESLDAVYEKVKAREGVKVDFAPERLGQSETRHMMFFLPCCGIRVELIGALP